MQKITLKLQNSAECNLQFAIYIFFALFVIFNKTIFLLPATILSFVLLVKIIRTDSPFKSYDIYFATPPQKTLQKVVNSNQVTRQVIIICDKNIDPTPLQTQLLSAGAVNLHIIKLQKDGEAIKQFEVFEWLLEQLLALKPTRNTLLIALGGGTIGDLTGFCASVLLRGVDYIQYPTTLLAMADSSVGGKTAINTQTSKNMIGSFYQPLVVICDPLFLNTLSKTQFLSGYAEVLKYGLIWDARFYKYLINKQYTTQCIVYKLQVGEKFNKSESDFLSYIVKKSCLIKTKIVSMDERETKGIRELLNFGHTIGHGLEKCSAFKGKITHGQAIAFGMLYECKLSGLCTATLEKHYAAVGLETQIKIEGLELEIMQIISQDKKNNDPTFTTLSHNGAEKQIRSSIGIVLLNSLGRSTFTQIFSTKIFSLLTNKDLS